MIFLRNKTIPMAFSGVVVVSVLALVMVQTGTASFSVAGSDPVTVSDEMELREAFGDPATSTIVLSNDIVLADCDEGAFTRDSDEDILLDGRGFSVNSECALPPPDTGSDMSVVKVAPASVAPDSPVLYQITLENFGNESTGSPETNPVVMEDQFPEGFDYENFTLSNDFFECEVNDDLLVCENLEALEPSDSTTISVSGVASAAPGETLSNTATIVEGGGTNTDNDSSTATTLVVDENTPLIGNPGPFVTAINFFDISIGTLLDFGGAQWTGGTASETGNLTLPNKTFQTEPFEISEGFTVVVTVTLSNATGFVFPAGGNMNIAADLRVAFSGAQISTANCALTPGRVQLVSGQSGSLTGRSYDAGSGNVELVNNTFTVSALTSGGTNGCGDAASSLNATLGLPSQPEDFFISMDADLNPPLVPPASPESSPLSGSSVDAQVIEDLSWEIFAVSGDSTATFSDVTILNGFNPDGMGGAINGSKVVLDNVVISNSFARMGGAVSATELRVINSVFNSNEAFIGGGAIYLDGGAVAEIVESMFSSNSSQGEGGAVFLDEGVNEVIIRNSTVANNFSSRGGGVAFVTTAGDGSENEGRAVVVDGTTFVGNTALLEGGGMFISDGSSVSITNSTFYENEGSEGGGIYSSDSISEEQALRLSYLTLAENIALAGDGNSLDVGGVYDAWGIIVSSDVGGTECVLRDATPSTSYSFSSDSSCGWSEEGSGNVVNGGALLFAPFGENGGPTETLPPMPTSLVVDVIPLNECVAYGVLLDQRGVLRPIGSGCDMGAVEVAGQPTPPVPPPPPPPTPTPTPPPAPAPHPVQPDTTENDFILMPRFTS